MRIVSLIPSLLVSVSLPVLAFAATPIAMNDWHVSPMMAANSSAPSYCAMATQYSNGPMVTFTRNASDKGSIAVDFPGAEMEKGQEYAVTLKTGNFKKTYSARAISLTQLVLQTGQNKELDDAMSSGSPITLSLDGTPGIYTLQGNVQAFFEFDHCIKGLKPAVNTTQMAMAAPVAPVITSTLPAPVPSAPMAITTPLATPTAPVIAKTTAPLFDTTKPAVVMAAHDTLAPVITGPAVVSSPVSKPTIVATTPVAPKAMPIPVIAPQIAAAPAPAAKPLQIASLFDSYTTMPVASNDAPSRIAPAKPMELTPAPAAVKAPAPIIQQSPQPVPQPAAILWDKPLAEKAAPVPVAAPVIKTPPVENYSEITPVHKPIEKPAATLPVKNVMPAPSIEKLAATTPVAGTENPDTSRLKSSLAQARAEANNVPALLPVTPPPSPAKAITPVPALKPVVQNTPIREPMTREPLARASTRDSAIEDLLYDDKASAKKAAVAATPAPMMIKEETFNKPVEQKPILPMPAPKAPMPPVSAPPIVKEEIQKIPAAMPPAIKPTMAVSAEPEMKRAPVATQLNTMTPSVGHPAQAKFAAPVIPVQALPNIAAPQLKASSSVDFRPPPAAAKGIWTTRSVGNGPDNSFCLMENQFNNDTLLMVGQRADGSSTLGVNYGIDMLDPQKSYTVTVQLDNQFEETFTGYAENPKTLVVQIGKKPSFFSTLASSDAARIAIPGAASSYALQGVPAGLSAFSSCLTKLGGAPIAAAAPMLVPIMPMVPVVPNERVIANPLDDPSVSTSVTPPVKIAEIKGESLESAMAKVMPAPKTALPPVAVAAPAPIPVLKPTAAAISAAPANAMPAPAPKISDNLIWDKTDALPVTTTMLSPEPKANIAPAVPPAIIPAPVKNAPGNNPWNNDVRGVLSQLDASPNFTGDAASWSSDGLKGKAVASSQKDILDAASDAMDQAEKSCKGQFSSQMGVPDGNTLPMESKCIGTNGVTTISTWIAQQSGQATTIWSMEAPRDQRDQAFKARDKLLNVLQTAPGSGKQS